MSRVEVKLSQYYKIRKDDICTDLFYLKPKTIYMRAVMCYMNGIFEYIEKSRTEEGEIPETPKEIITAFKMYCLKDKIKI